MGQVDPHVEQELHQGVSRELAVVLNDFIPLEHVDAVLLREPWGTRGGWGLVAHGSRPGLPPPPPHA